VGKDGLDKEHIGESITDSLVDQISQSLEALQGVLLGRRLGLGILDSLHSILREGHGAVAVSFKVDTDVKAESGVVKVLHTGVGADDGKLEHLFNVVRAGTVGVGGLDDANLELLGNASVASKVANERGGESGNTVTVQKAENVALVDKVVNQTVSITVQRSAAIKDASLGRGGSALLGLNVVGTTLERSQLFAPAM
jgi:hypothetical protein